MEMDSLSGLRWETKGVEFIFDQMHVFKQFRLPCSMAGIMQTNRQPSGIHGHPSKPPTTANH